MKHKYTYGTTPFEVIEQELPNKYSMELNKNDMLKLLRALHNIALCSDIEQPTVEWAENFRGSILETIGIEEI